MIPLPHPNSEKIIDLYRSAGDLFDFMGDDFFSAKIIN